MFSLSDEDGVDYRRYTLVIYLTFCCSVAYPFLSLSASANRQDLEVNTTL